MKRTILFLGLAVVVCAMVSEARAQNTENRKASWSGDIRLRWQGDYQARTHARNALQWAFRLNVAKSVNDRTSFGMQLMTGDPQALPVAGWTNATGFLAQKPVHLQHLYGRYSPVSEVVLTGGKFGSPFFRATQLVFDNDIPFEGLAQQIRIPNGTGTAALLVNLAEIMINQPLSASRNTTRSYFLGGQIGANFTRGNTKGTIALALYHIGNADSIFVAENVPPRLVRTVNTNRPNAARNGYESEFRYFNLGTRFTRPLAGRPFTLNVDYAFNPAAGDERHGIVGMVTYGDHRRLGGVRVAGQAFMVQADALATVFANIDYIRTNQNGAGVSVNYQPVENIDLMWAAYGYEWRNPALLVNPTTRNGLRSRFRFQIQMWF